MDKRATITLLTKVSTQNPIGNRDENFVTVATFRAAYVPNTGRMDVGAAALHTETDCEFQIRYSPLPQSDMYVVFGVTPLAPVADAVLAATALTSSLQAITTGIVQPDVPRNVTATVLPSIAGDAGSVTVTGTDAMGNTISEALALNGLATAAGAQTFATITEIDLPANSNGYSVEVGIGSTLGLSYRTGVVYYIQAVIDVAGLHRDLRILCKREK